MNIIEEKELEFKLRAIFSDKNISVVSITENKTGIYKAQGSSFNRIFGVKKEVVGLPEYVDVRIEWRTGKHVIKIIVWLPEKWNGRFAGTVGGGMNTGGEGFLTAPDDYTRGWTVPYAIERGYAAATADACNTKGFQDLILDKKTGELDKELYENWRARATHYMTIIGKSVTEIFYGKQIEYSYLSGGSGGGRQSLVEAQEYPEDYDGIWASCPAINWGRLLVQGLWPFAVMNHYHHKLSLHKIRFFQEKAWLAAGGRDAYFCYPKRVKFNPCAVVGEKTKKGKITELDAKVMAEIWNGSHEREGNRLWYGFRPGAQFWNVAIPVGAFYYSFPFGKVKPFFLATTFTRWITKNYRQNFTTITKQEFESLFKKMEVEFEDCLGVKADLSEYAKRGGKIIIDHGLNDPLIPVDGTADYYCHVVEVMGKDKVQDFLRLYLVPGDGHGNCWNEEPGISQSVGILALREWVENGKAPDALDGVKVDMKNKTILKTKKIQPVKEIEDWI